MLFDIMATNKNIIKGSIQIDSDVDDKTTIEIKKKPRKRRGVPFSEDILTSPDGLERLYHDFSRAQNQKPLFRGRGYEEQDLKNMLRMYKDWAFNLYPGLSFIDLLNRIESLESKPKVRACMGRLRETERNRYLVKQLITNRTLQISSFNYIYILYSMKF
jgi:hypothetical protein